MNDNLWLWRNPLPQGNALRAVTYAQGLFVAVGQFGTIMTSRDGINWTIQNSGTTNYLSGVGFGNGLYVAVGMEGTILTSPDGVTWSPQESGTTAWLDDVAFGNGLL